MILAIFLTKTSHNPGLFSPNPRLTWKKLLFLQPDMRMFLSVAPIQGQYHLHEGFFGEMSSVLL